MGQSLGPNIVRHRTKLYLLDAKPIHSAPFRAGLKALEFDRNEVDKMLLDGVIEATQTEWAATIVFGP